MTPKENTVAFFNREKYEWQPLLTDWSFFGPEELSDYIGRGFVLQQEPYPREKFGGLGWFGVNWKFDPALNGSIDIGRVFDDLSEWREKMPIPDLDKHDWEGIAKKNYNYLHSDKYLDLPMFTGYFERLIALMDFQDALLAMIDEDQEKDLNDLFTLLTDVYDDYIRRCHKYFGIQMVEFNDDWGSQRAPLMAPSVIEKKIMPHMKRLIDTCHELGVLFHLHSCGLVEDLVPMMIDYGIDTWVGQTCCDKLKLVKQYGDKFRFGVELRPAGNMSDDELVKWITDMAETYRPYDVWWQTIAKELPPEQKPILFETITPLVQR